jgi:hypothetical protein
MMQFSEHVSVIKGCVTLYPYRIIPKIDISGLLTGEMGSWRSLVGTSLKSVYNLNVLNLEPFGWIAY